VACDLLNQGQNEKIMTRGDEKREKQFGLKLSEKKAIVLIEKIEW
jgi:hypothetical protein